MKTESESLEFDQIIESEIKRSDLQSKALVDLDKALLSASNSINKIIGGAPVFLSTQKKNISSIEMAQTFMNATQTGMLFNTKKIKSNNSDKKVYLQNNLEDIEICTISVSETGDYISVYFDKARMKYPTSHEGIFKCVKEILKRDGVIEEAVRLSKKMT